MAKQRQSASHLLRWSQHVPASNVQDPLGLGLRGSTRLASQLLHCITSITPRARYFSFLPWSVFHFQSREKGKPFALGLYDAIILREQALTLACLARHEGEPCVGRRLVGSRDGRKWYFKREKQANFRKIKKFAQSPAWGAYFKSLVNLGFFVTDQQLPDTDEQTAPHELTFDDIELSELGLDLAKRYGAGVGTLAVTRQIAAKERSCTVTGLAEFGKYGGLCELTDGQALDRELLRDIFFDLVHAKGEAHVFRRRSLLLILEICRQFSAENWLMDDDGFAGVVYFGEIANDEDRQQVRLPGKLQDIATRWRMFYFHHFMRVALEGLFSWLVSQPAASELPGTTVESLVAQLDEKAVRKRLSELLQVSLTGSFGDWTPARLYATQGIQGDELDTGVSKALDNKVRSLHPFAEDSLEILIRNRDDLYSSTGLALPLVLLATTLARYTQWEATNYGKWLAGAANDPFLDLVPPVLMMGLARHFGKWWTCTWKQLAGFVLSRYVVQQHQSMSYEKTWRGDRCLLQVDGSKIMSTGGFDKIGMGNPRFGSAVQILKDLALLADDENGVTHLTTEAKHFLKRELVKEVENEVS